MHHAHFPTEGALTFARLVGDVEDLKKHPVEFAAACADLFRFAALRLASPSAEPDEGPDDESAEGAEAAPKKSRRSRPKAEHFTQGRILEELASHGRLRAQTGGSDPPGKDAFAVPAKDLLDFVTKAAQEHLGS